ncbi:Uncharacterised protein [Mycobacteroides abscessus subsp. abscessus]|nr:Uncharacterised protein [Mycobacteroides abscessus subsp. abscessus]
MAVPNPRETAPAIDVKPVPTAAAKRMISGWCSLMNPATLSMPTVICPSASVPLPRNGEMIDSPRRPSAAPMFLTEPSKVPPIFLAAPPTFWAMTRWNVAASTWPFSTILDSSAPVTLYSFCSQAKIGNPRSPSMFRSSVIALPEVCTLLKMCPISLRSAPAIAAASATVVRYLDKSSPGLTPAATAVAAVVAAASIEKAVPFTEPCAAAMICATAVASLPRACNLNRVASRLLARSNPADSVLYASPVTPRAMAAGPATRVIAPSMPAAARPPPPEPPLRPLLPGISTLIGALTLGALTFAEASCWAKRCTH